MKFSGDYLPSCRSRNNNIIVSSINGRKTFGLWSIEKLVREHLAKSIRKLMG
jgi:hypothetical protein